MFVFRKIWCALSSCNTRFEIRPFALPPTNCLKLALISLSYFSPETNTVFQEKIRSLVMPEA